MRGLLQLFATYGNFLLFLALEGIALFMVVQFNHRQRAIWGNSLGLAAASTEATVDRIGDYVGLREEVIRLQGANIALMEQLDNARYRNAIKRDTAFSEASEPLYTFIGANVVSNEVTSLSNTFRLDKGRLHGVEPGMGVIATEGIAGVVLAVSDHFSLVMSILHRESRVKAEIASSGYFGTLTWNGKSPRYLTLEAIPKHAALLEGDTVVTSGYSNLFPEGIMVGEVAEIALPAGENFYQVKVELVNDLSRLRYVYIVENQMREEHEQLDEVANE